VSEATEHYGIGGDDMKHVLRCLLMVAPVLAILGCSTTQTKVTAEKTTPGQKISMKKVLVLGVGNDEARRIQFEKDFSEQLKKHGVTPVAAYTLFPGDTIPDKATLKQQLEKNGIDTVLITRVVDRKNVQTYVPGMTYSHYNTYWDYYGTSLDYAYSPGYTVDNVEAVLETNLYNVASEQLQWTATSETTTQGDNNDIIKSFISEMVKKMQKDKLIK
jgi:hypothetical protein